MFSSEILADQRRGEGPHGCGNFMRNCRVHQSIKLEVRFLPRRGPLNTRRLVSYYVNVPALRPGTAGAYVHAVLAAGAATVLRIAIDPYVAGIHYITFFPAVIITALISGFGAGLFRMVQSAAVSSFFLLPPSFYVGSPADLNGLLLFMLEAFFYVILITVLRSTLKHYQELERLLRRQADLLDQSHDAILTMHTDDRRIVYWNRGAERLYGYRLPKRRDAEPTNCCRHAVLSRSRTSTRRLSMKGAGTANSPIPRTTDGIWWSRAALSRPVRRQDVCSDDERRHCRPQAYRRGLTQERGPFQDLSPLLAGALHVVRRSGTNAWRQQKLAHGSRRCLCRRLSLSRGLHKLN
jgi:PAS domain-containing protein